MSADGENNNKNLTRAGHTVPNILRGPGGLRDNLYLWNGVPPPTNEEAACKEKSLYSSLVFFSQSTLSRVLSKD